MSIIEGVRDIPREIEPWLSEWRSIHRDPPPGLFHYTNATGLQGIVNSGELWATHMFYLNDAQEFKFASQVINAVFEKRITEQKGSLAENPVKLLHETYRAHIFMVESYVDPYAICFCAEGNLLSQWRAYAANGQGFAIEFDPAMLRNALKRDAEVAANAKLLKIVYDEQEQQRLVSQAIDSLIAAMDTNHHEQVLHLVPLVFSEMSLCFKHKAFSEEREWRLTFMPRSERFLNVRISDGKLVPYAFLRISDHATRPPYVSITHGPTLESGSTTRALKMLLGKAQALPPTIGRTSRCSVLTRPYVLARGRGS